MNITSTVYFVDIGTLVNKALSILDVIRVSLVTYLSNYRTNTLVLSHRFSEKSINWQINKSNKTIICHASADNAGFVTLFIVAIIVYLYTGLKLGKCIFSFIVLWMILKKWYPNCLDLNLKGLNYSHNLR